ncbi:hypothetical protein C8A00DRAFT_13579 [Chaetomidium leptoderma]|uniref:Uncharacterized protein n=1 Tax=Chaetomidium leptoderma TaxID=669021 RepID=A0AAN6ZX92_9PEZI|nr:hypothetical protein C8A00DRAFT_13579 [Chaetomidium leptoderma]
MERDGTEKTGPSPDTRVGQPSTRFTSPLVINSASRRKSLFSRTRTKEDAARPTSSGSASDANAASTNNTRIPRPAGQRRPVTLSDAYRMAEEEEVAQGSPSPAPRFWRSRRESAENRTTKTGSPRTSSPRTSSTPRRGGLGGEALGSRRDHSRAPSQQSDLSDTAFDEKLRQYELDQTGPEEPGRRSNGLFSRSRLGTKIVETGKELLVRKASRGSLDSSSSPQAAKVTTSSPSLLRRMSGRRRESSSASSLARNSADWAQPDGNAQIEPLQPSASPLAGSGTDLQASQTPNRSFAWQADADFTAGDLQFSNSPPVAIGRSNTKIDEIRALEAKVKDQFPESPNHRPWDTGIDNIRAREIGTALRFTNEPQEPDQAVSGTTAARPENEDRVPNHRPVSRASMRMDEPRSREIESLSKRALATARLGEFRERNIGTSRSPSPDIARRSSRERVRAFSPLRDRLRRQENEAVATTVPAEEGQTGQNILAPALPVQHHFPSNKGDARHNRGMGEEGQELHRGSSQARDEAGDVLRQLATATNSEPAPEAPVAADSQPPAVRDRGPAERARQRRSIGGAKNGVRPTVGFTGLSRSSSVESRAAKRMSFAHSDSDPTERIEGEMNLFAPQENQSERGSLRAPSPKTDDEMPDETPKPTKIDPLTQPTPRVTGAFVETPATVKVEKLEGPATAPADESKDTDPLRNGHRRLSTDSSGDSNSSVAQGGKGGITARQQKRAQSSRGDRVSGRSSSLSARRRARSLSRSRTPLTNSTRPPTVRDDLLEIQRANQIDDSTLDDIADLLSHQDHLDAVLGSSQGVKNENSNSDKLDRQRELEAYDRMSRSLETGLLGIRSAKQGIERLEDKVAQADIKDHHHPQHAAHSGSAKESSPPCPVCDGSAPPTAAAVTYVHLPLPRLWYRQPKFRFTLLGLGLFLLSLWYIAESWVCFRYCKPEYCYPGAPCGWSSDDPVWGHAIPVKLDQWVAGGRGRDLARRIRPEVADWLADMRDAATGGADLAAVDTSRYSREQKRQHRRRLAKKGLIKPFVERPEDKAMFRGWKSVREAKERAQSAQEMGYEVDEDDDIAADERL